MFFCKNGFVNNCTDDNGGWALGCRIDGGQAEYVRVPPSSEPLAVGAMTREQLDAELQRVLIPSKQENIFCR